MNQLENIYQKLAVKGVRLVQGKQKLEALFRLEKRYLKDGRERKSKIRSVDEIIYHFWNGVDILKKDQCWNWKRSVNIHKNNGIGNYGTMWIHMKKYKTHRLSYLLSCGDIGDFYVCHKCDNPQCCNPHHLFLGTPKDNVRDCIKKNRFKIEKGEDRYCAKLTVDAVLDIKKNYQYKKVTAEYFANKYKVSKRAIWNILNGLRWKHVTP